MNCWFWHFYNPSLFAMNSAQTAGISSYLTLFGWLNWCSRRQPIIIALQKYSYPLWMILHFTNPHDNDTLSLPRNLPFGVYLALEVGIIMATSFPVKANTCMCPQLVWPSQNMPCHSDNLQRKSNPSDMQKNVKTHAAERKKTSFCFSAISCMRPYSVGE